MIGAPTTLTTSGQRFCRFVPLFSTNNDTATIQPFIAALHVRQKIIFECCGSIGHKANACIIHGPRLIPSSLRIKMNKFNTLHGGETADPPRECNIQPTVSPLKYRTSPPKTSPVVSDIMDRLNHHVVDDGDVDVLH